LEDFSSKEEKFEQWRYNKSQILYSAGFFHHLSNIITNEESPLDTFRQVGVLPVKRTVK